MVNSKLLGFQTLTAEWRKDGQVGIQWTFENERLLVQGGQLCIRGGLPILVICMCSSIDPPDLLVAGVSSESSDGSNRAGILSTRSLNATVPALIPPVSQTTYAPVF